MNKKELVIVSIGFVFLLFLANFAFAAENETTDKIGDAYKCLRNQTAGKNLSLEEAVFTTLALGGQEAFGQVDSFRDVNSCWKNGACTLKETAQVLLAYKGIGQDTTSIKNWILSKNTTANELKWLLEIDITNKAQSICTIKDGQRTSTITISEDSTISGSTGACFTLDQGNYMLRVTSSCLRNEFEISCDQDFVTSVLYQRTTGGTLFVLPEAHSAASLGSTKEKINGECLKTGTTCDYEGTLWAALALHKLGLESEVSKLMPYLLALADDNTRFFPSTFLYILVGGDDQYNLIIEQQKQGKFWEMVGTRSGRYYDTSLAMLGLAGKPEIDATKDYLLSIQTKEGCWNNNNIRDTAFILYSGWPRTVASVGSISSAPCESPNSCENLFECTNANGSSVALECPGTEVCCTVAVEKETCSQKNGLICSSSQDCTGNFESSADGSCCVGGICENVQQVDDTCTLAGGTCRSLCDEGNEEENYIETCSLTGERCCMAKKGGLGWIIILLILGILVALGIIFRNKLRIWWYKIAEKFRKKPITQPATRAAGPGQQLGPYPRQMIPQRPMAQPAAIQPRQIRPVAKDKEMEEALRKLREMAGRK